VATGDNIGLVVGGRHWYTGKGVPMTSDERIKVLKYVALGFRQSRSKNLLESMDTMQGMLLFYSQGSLAA
jgi:hypothetical protein